MQYTKLGNAGITVSRICLGCMSYGDGKWREWTVGANEARDHFAAALEAGVNFFDTADVYSGGVSEEITGRWLGEMASRDDIVIATKVNGPMGPGPNRRGLSRKHILEACDNSLRRLKTDFIDLYQIHRWDFSKALFVAKEHGWHRFLAMQNHYNLIYHEEEREMMPLSVEQGIGVIPW